MTFYSKETERLIIANAFIRSAFNALDRQLSTLDFYTDSHRGVWSKMMEADEEGRPIQPVEILESCQKVEPNFPLTLSEVGRMLDEFVTFAPGPGDYRHLTYLTAARSVQRRLHDALKQLNHWEDLEVLQRELESIGGSIQSVLSTAAGKSLSVKEVFEVEVFPRLDKFVSGETIKLPFGFKDLDSVTNGGAGIGELVITAAKPKDGKSAMLLQVAHYQAFNGFPALIVSREMLNFENGFRLLTQVGPLSNNVFGPGMPEPICAALKGIAAQVWKIPLYFDDKSATVAEIRAEVRRLKETTDLASVFVDYAQLVKPRAKSEGRPQDLEGIFYDLKELAQNEEIVVYLNAQFNREGIESERPRMSHLDGSSAGEKAGNLIIMWTLERDVDPETLGRRGTLWIEAGRNVAYDEFPILFKGQHSRFEFPRQNGPNEADGNEA
jgi:replicative DNA helicase